jgi:hypothetical protein
MFVLRTLHLSEGAEAYKNLKGNQLFHKAAELKLINILKPINGVPNIHTAIDQRLLTIQQLKEMSPENLETLLESDHCIPVLRELRLAEGITQLNQLSGQELFDKASELINAKSRFNPAS